MQTQTQVQQQKETASGTQSGSRVELDARRWMMLTGTAVVRREGGHARMLAWPYGVHFARLLMDREA